MTSHSWLHYTCGSIFSIVAIVHVVRILLNLNVVIGNWSLPLWVSGWIALILLVLSVWLFKTA